MAGRNVTGLAVFLSAALLLAGAATARADPFYLRYDADEVYPEDAGWTRYWQDPSGAEKRSLEDGWLTLDTRASYSIFDIYYVQSSAFELRPAEELRVAWRMQALEGDTSSFRSDTSMFVSNAQGAYAKFFLAPGFVSEWGWGLDGPDHVLEISPEAAHEYLLTSSDMCTYELYVDGTIAFSGEFLFSAIIGPLVVAWGDSVIGRTSLSRWDYVCSQVVPEPTAIVLAVGVCVTFSAYRRKP